MGAEKEGVGRASCSAVWPLAWAALRGSVRGVAGSHACGRWGRRASYALLQQLGGWMTPPLLTVAP